jgi:hypothetical protein
MITLSNSIVSRHPLVEHFPLVDTRGGLPAVNHGCQWLLDKINAPSDLSTATWAGRVADIIALMVDSSGMRQVYIVEFKRHVNDEAIRLLQTWIEQYGSDRDPDLDKQLKELNANRLSFRR